MSVFKKGRWFYIVLCIFSFFILFRVYFHLTDDFRISNISFQMPVKEEWDIAPLSSSEQDFVNQILSQQFTYIGKGAQSYVFGSEDGSYVIKFFKFKHLKPSWVVDLLPDIEPFSTYKKKVAARKARKLYGVFNSYRLAYETNREESGLIFIQLNPTQEQKEVTLVDKIGFTRNVEINSIPFIIQYKGETLRDVLSNLLKENQVETAKQRIDQVFDLYMSEYRKSIYDHDHGVMHNTGFYQNKPFHLDVGKLNSFEYTPEFCYDDLHKVAFKIAKWTRHQFPEYSHEIELSMAQKSNQIFGQPFIFPEKIPSLKH